MQTRLQIDPEAQAIANRALEATGHALLTGNFEAFAPQFAVPHHFTTPDGTRRIDRMEGIKATFDSVVRHYRAQDVVDFHRTVETAFFETETVLHFSYSTQLRFADKSLDAPYYSRGTMQKRDGTWRAVETYYALGPRKAQSAAILRRAETPPARDASAQQIVQQVLDEMTELFFQEDYVSYAARIKLPFFTQGDEGSRVFTHAAQLWPDLQSYRTQFLVYEVTDFIRTVKWAERIGEGRIQGMYRNYILSGSRIIVEPFTSAITLEGAKDGLWQCTSVLHPIGHLSNSVLRPQPEEDR